MEASVGTARQEVTLQIPEKTVEKKDHHPSDCPYGESISSRILGVYHWETQWSEH